MSRPTSKARIRDSKRHRLCSRLYLLLVARARRTEQCLCSSLAFREVALGYRRLWDGKPEGTRPHLHQEPNLQAPQTRRMQVHGGTRRACAGNTNDSENVLGLFSAA